MHGCSAPRKALRGLLQHVGRNGLRRLPVYRYRLIDRVGNDLGLFVSGFEDWRPGRIILRPSGDYEVRAVVAAQPGEPFGAYLIVEQSSVGGRIRSRGPQEGGAE